MQTIHQKGKNIEDFRIYASVNSFLDQFVEHPDSKIVFPSNRVYNMYN